MLAKSTEKDCAPPVLKMAIYLFVFFSTFGLKVLSWPIVPTIGANAFYATILPIRQALSEVTDYFFLSK